VSGEIVFFGFSFGKAEVKSNSKKRGREKKQQEKGWGGGGGGGGWYLVGKTELGSHDEVTHAFQKPSAEKEKKVMFPGKGAQLLYEAISIDRGVKPDGDVQVDKVPRSDATKGRKLAGGGGGGGQKSPSGQWSEKEGP